MSISIDQLIYGVGIILIPIIVALIHKKRKSHKIENIEDNKIIEIELRLKKLEESIINNHIEIDEAKLEIAYIKGKISHGR